MCFWWLGCRSSPKYQDDLAAPPPKVGDVDARDVDPENPGAESGAECGALSRSWAQLCKSSCCKYSPAPPTAKNAVMMMDNVGVTSSAHGPGSSGLSGTARAPFQSPAPQRETQEAGGARGIDTHITITVCFVWGGVTSLHWFPVR